MLCWKLDNLLARAGRRGCEKHGRRSHLQGKVANAKQTTFEHDAGLQLGSLQWGEHVGGVRFSTIADDLFENVQSRP